MTETLLRLNSTLNGYVWGWPMIVLLMGTGLLLTILTGAVQFRRLGIRPARGAGENSPSAAAGRGGQPLPGGGHRARLHGRRRQHCRRGHGDLPSAAPARCSGCGCPGCSAWRRSIAEIVVALHYREPDDSGTMRGGAMYVLKKGLGRPWLGGVFALLTALAAFGIGNMVQANSVADALQATFACSHQDDGPRRSSSSRRWSSSAASNPSRE